jgi:hypothetical protein
MKTKLSTRRISLSLIYEFAARRWLTPSRADALTLSGGNKSFSFQFEARGNRRISLLSSLPNNSKANNSKLKSVLFRNGAAQVHHRQQHEHVSLDQ